MRILLLLKLLLVGFLSPIFCQEKSGYIVYFDHISGNPDISRIDLDEGRSVFIDSVKAIEIGRLCKRFTEFIGEFARINTGAVIGFGFKPACGVKTSPQVPVNIPFKTFTFDFKNYEKPILIYLYKVKVKQCTATRKNLPGVQGGYTENVNFISIANIISVEQVEDCFVESVKQQLSKFAFGGYDGFYDDGINF